MQLREIVEKYLALAGGYGRPAPLGGFGLRREETERVFSIFDEDYHISRFFHFSDQRALPGEPTHGEKEANQEAYQVNGFPHTHVAIDAEIESIL